MQTSFHLRSYLSTTAASSSYTCVCHLTFDTISACSQRIDLLQLQDNFIAFGVTTVTSKFNGTMPVNKKLESSPVGPWERIGKPAKQVNVCWAHPCTPIDTVAENATSPITSWLKMRNYFKRTNNFFRSQVTTALHMKCEVKLRSKMRFRYRPRMFTEKSLAKRVLYFTARKLQLGVKTSISLLTILRLS